MKHIRSLDGLRGVAVLMVVAFHYLPRAGTGVLGMAASAGWMGVDVFFVLSGFLITSILLTQRGSPHFFRNFYLRRVLRLFPLYYFILFIILALTPVLHIHWKLPQVTFFLYCSNFLLARSESWGIVGPFVLLHTWTLALEEQFYLVWPWLVGARSMNRRGLLAVCVTGIIVAPLLRSVLLFNHFDPAVILYSLPTRMDALLLGAALALYPLPSIKSAWAAFLLCSLVLIVQGVHHHSLNIFTWGWFAGPSLSLVALASAGVLVLALHPGTVIRRTLERAWIRFFGRYSYGIYLWHLLFNQWFIQFQSFIDHKITQRFTAACLAFVIPLLVSTCLALISYHGLELHFLRIKDRFGH